MFLGTEIFHVLKAVLNLGDSMLHRKLQCNFCPWSVLRTAVLRERLVPTFVYPVYKFLSSRMSSCSGLGLTGR